MQDVENQNEDCGCEGYVTDEQAQAFSDKFAAILDEADKDENITTKADLKALIERSNIPHEMLIVAVTEYVADKMRMLNDPLAMLAHILDRD